MNNEIVFVCNSVNNKNVREGELKILRKPDEYEKKLYFEFGSDENNIKKRFYNDVETLNKDFNELLKLKNMEELAEESEEILNKKLTKEFLEEHVIAEIPIIKEETKEETKEQPRKNYKKYNKKSLF